MNDVIPWLGGLSRGDRCTFTIASVIDGVSYDVHTSLKQMRYDTNHKERTRARVLAQAAAEVRKKGVERVSVARVMAGAGLTHGGFYAHFGSKDDMIAQAITHMFDAAYAKFLGDTERRKPADGLARYVHGYLS